MRRTLSLLPAALIATACASSDSDAPPALDRQARALAFLPNGEALVVSPDEGLVSRVDVDGKTYRTLAVGTLPERVLVVDSKAYVSLHGDRVLKVLQIEGSSLSEEASIDVCASPIAMVKNQNQDRLYVACTVGEEVLELSLPDHRVLQRFHVAAQPAWLALSPGEAVLYVGVRLSGDLNWIQLESGTVHRDSLDRDPTARPVPTAFEANFRINADLIVDPMRRELMLPGQRRAVFYYGNEGPTTNPEVLVVPLAEDETPLLDEMRPVSHPVAGRLGAIVAADPLDARRFWSLHGESTLAYGVLRVEPVPYDRSETMLVIRALATIQTEVGARDLTWRGEQGLVWSEVRRSVATLPLLQLQAHVDAQVLALSEYDQCIREGWKDCEAPSADIVLDQRRGGFEVAPRVLSEEAERGRELYNGTQTAATACASCHPRGLGDGYNWLRPENRQTRILPGLSAASTSLRWDGSVRSLDEELRLALAIGTESVDLASAESLGALAAYIEILPAPVPRRVEARDPCVIRGRALFESETTGCRSCHAAADYSGDQKFERRGQDGFGLSKLAEVRTPSLVGVGASPPYLHDGSAPSLMDLLTGPKASELGNTASLDQAQIEDLVCFLESL